MRIGSLALPLALASTMLLATGCPPKPPPGTNGTVTVQATDAPFAANVVTGATITVTQILMHTDATASSGYTTIFDTATGAAPIQVDIFHLRDGLQQALATASVPPGDYRQVRVVISAASLALTNGNSYTYPQANGSTGAIQPTSAATSGLKIMIDPPLTVVSSVASTLLLDVDLQQSFLPTPANDALSANAYHLQPVIRAENVSTVGTISGTVTQAGAPAASATVQIFDASHTLVTSTATDASGNFIAQALPPATTYTVTATLGSATGQAASQPVAAGSNTVCNVTIQ
jgi:hypothetical protein